MTHADHVRLFQKGIDPTLEIWADLGSGEGAFILALAGLIHPKSIIYSIDKDWERLAGQKQLFFRLFPNTRVHFLHSDFSRKLDLPLLNGIIMANSLHYIKDQKGLLVSLRTHIKPGGKLITVEYNTECRNSWVAYPVSYARFAELLQESGYTNPQLLGSVLSAFLREIYAAMSLTV
jgi:SAM-dependent methyltransferase